MPGKGTQEQLLTTVKQIIEECYEFNSPVILCVLDYRKAFDFVTWYTLWHILGEFGLPVHPLMITQKLYERHVVYVKIDGQLSESFQTGKRNETGLHTSTYDLKWIMRRATENSNCGIMIKNWRRF